MSKLEKKFSKSYKKYIIAVTKDFEHIRQKCRRKIEKLSEETGVPYNETIRGYSIVYTPSSLNSKWEENKKKFNIETNDYDDEFYDYFDNIMLGEPGWTHSQIC